MFIRSARNFFVSTGPVTQLLLIALFGASCVLLGAILVGCGVTARAPGATDPLPSEGVLLEWGVVTNRPEGGFVSELIIRNEGPRTLSDDGWALFFNFGRPIDPATVTPTVRIDHINGDFYRLVPTEDFSALAPGSRTRITFTSGAWAINESDAPDGFYFVWGDEETGRIDLAGDPIVLPFTEAEQMRRSGTDQLPVVTPERVYDEDRPLHEIADVPRIIPRPQEIEFGSGLLMLEPEVTVVHADGLERDASYLADALEDVMDERPAVTLDNSPDQSADLQDARGRPVNAPGRIVLALDASLPAEGYVLETVEAEDGDPVENPTAHVSIVGGSPAGVFYGIQSFRALMPIEVYATPAPVLTIPEVRVEDEPRFGYRGMHLDVSRNFHGPDDVKRLLDLMSLYKLNRLHFHLTDDEGWRIAIEELPELTTVGGRRGHTLTEEEHLIPNLGSGPFADPERSRGSGYYTREQYKDILQYAHQRHIEVVPEIDLPGHARAAIVAMEARARNTGSSDYLISDPLDRSEYQSVQMFEGNVINVCMPSTYRFLETVFDDVVEIYDEAGVPLRAIHTGGDEVPHGVWEESPACEELMRRSTDVNSVDDLHDYFLRRIDAMLDRHGLITAGWEEIALTERGGDIQPNPAFVDAGFRAYVWNAVWGWGAEDNVYKLANAGYDVVISNASNFYFDLAQEKHPEEPGLYWGGFVDVKAPFSFIPFDLYKSAGLDLMGNPIPDTAYGGAERLTLAGRENILGLQAQLWSENVKSSDRLEYMIFPRLLALAERNWAERPDWALVDDPERREEELARDWNVFANALGQRELMRLDHLGVNYRIPPPGAVIENGMLRANTAFPGMTIRYTTDGSEPTEASPVYTGPVAVEGPVALRTFSSTGRGSRTVTVGR